MNIWDSEGVLQALEAACRDAGGQNAYARKIGLSGPFISLVLAGKRQIPDTILGHLGYDRVITYRRK